MVSRFILMGALWLFRADAHAQASALKKAERYQEAGDLAAAIAQIEKATSHRKTEGRARTWFLYGRIYESVATSDDAAVQALDDDALTKALRGYNQARTLETGSDWATLSELQRDSLYNTFLNKGATAFQAADNAAALRFFTLAQQVKPDGRDAYMFAGIAAQEMEDVPNTLLNFRKRVELGGAEIMIYQSIIYYTRRDEDDLEGALKWTRKGRVAYPENTDLMKQEISLLIELGRSEEARETLIKTIEAEPDNANLRFNLGYLEEVVGNNDAAIAAYERALQIDPDYFDAIYNLGVYYFNGAADLYNAANALPIREYKTRGPELEAQAKRLLEKALPFMSRAAELQPDEAFIWNTLYTIHTRLGNDAQAEVAFRRYKALSGG
ncbi:MAG: tetratricopeptide repeat protein [Myxococcota bacterium]